MSYEWKEGYEYNGISPQTIQTLMNAMFDATYPIGSYYETSDISFNPNNEFVGEWELEAEGLVHISSGTNYNVSANDKDGGNSTINYTPSGSNAPVTLSESQCALPAHTHGSLTSGEKLLSTNAAGGTGVSRRTVASGSGAANVLYADYAVNRINSTSSTSKAATASHNHGFTGTQATLNVMQPYKIVNRWHRIA